MTRSAGASGSSGAIATSGSTARPSNARVAPSTKRAHQPAELVVRRRLQPRDGAIARLSRRSSQIPRRHVRRVEGDVDPVGAVLQEGRVDLDLPQLMGAGGGGRQDQEGGEEEGAKDRSGATVVSPQTVRSADGARMIHS